VVGVWSAVGVLLMALAALRWPSRPTIDAAITAAEAGETAPRAGARTGRDTVDTRTGPAGDDRRGPSEQLDGDPVGGRPGETGQRHAVT
jgi:hypothetical protein